MKGELLKPNQRIRIRVLAEGGLREYSGRIDRLTDMSIILNVTSREGSPHLREGEGVEVEIPAPDAKYIFTSEIKRVLPGEVPGIEVRRPKELVRHQRRGFVRVKAILPFSYRMWTGGPRGEGVTRNISGGGFLGVMSGLEEPLPAALLFEVEVRLPGEALPVVSRARVIRSWSEESEGKLQQVVAAEFVGLTEGDRKRIIQYVFRRQIELKQRGLL